MEQNGIDGFICGKSYYFSSVRIENGDAWVQYTDSSMFESTSVIKVVNEVDMCFILIFIRQLPVQKESFVTWMTEEEDEYLIFLVKLRDLGAWLLECSVGFLGNPRYNSISLSFSVVLCNFLSLNKKNELRKINVAIDISFLYFLHIGSSNVDIVVANVVCNFLKLFYQDIGIVVSFLSKSNHKESSCFYFFD